MAENNKLPDEIAAQNKVIFLQMIQGTIDRMSTSSAIFKGFSATIIAGVSAISFSDVNSWVLLLSFAPVLCFLILDVYYLRLERRYRALYEQVRTEKNDVNFDLSAPSAADILKKDKKSNVRIISCLRSPSIILFYLPMIIICIAVAVMKISGII